MYLVNSHIYVEDGAGTLIGEVRQRFHLWQRNYDLYLGKRQIATIKSPLLAWEFALRDENGGEQHLTLCRCSGLGFRNQGLWFEGLQKYDARYLHLARCTGGVRTEVSSASIQPRAFGYF